MSIKPKICGLLALGLFFVSAPFRNAIAADERIPPELFRHMAKVLGGRRVKSDLVLMGGDRSRNSLRNLYRRRILSVPVVISHNLSYGSSIVVDVSKKDSLAAIITNHHVVSNPLKRNKEGYPLVGLAFYSREMAGGMFQRKRLLECARASYRGTWCQAVRKVLRLGVVVGSDPDRDLALVLTRNPPAGVTGISEADMKSIQPGDEAAVIGHPKEFLWSLTQGIVSGVRYNFPLGKTLTTVIQTQAPIDKGSSGGPLLSLDGKLMGVIFAFQKGRQGLNLAVGVNEITSFYKEQLSKFRNR